MTLSTWQLIVVGALATIWVVVLGVPLIVDLLRWLRNRPPAADNEKIPARRQVLGYLEQRWWNRPRPFSAWRSQDIADRRFQTLLACGLATTVAMFLAIAFRGLFVPVFLAMLALSLLAVAIGAFVGAAERRHLADQAQARRQAQTDLGMGLTSTAEAMVDDAATEPFGGIDTLRPPTWRGEAGAQPEARSDPDRRAARMADSGLGQNTPDRSGFMFEPLNLDEALPSRRDRHLVDDLDIEVPIDHELVAELGLPIPTDDEYDENGPVAGFHAAPEAGARQASARARSTKRRTARPIYIESVLDEAENPSKAVND